MRQEFHRNQDPAARAAHLNRLSARVERNEARLDALEQGEPPPQIPAPGPLPDTTPDDDPGDLTLYYENGKA